MLVFGLEIPGWLALTLVAVCLFYWYGTSTYGVFKKMGVPYMMPLPFIGNIVDQLRMPGHEYDLMLRKRLSAKIFGSFLGRTPTLNVCDVDFLKQVTIKNFNNFINHRPLFDEVDIMTNNVANNEGDHWRHVRSILSPNFTSGKLKQMYGDINNCADKFVDHLRAANSTPVNFKEYTSGNTMDVIASTAFGLDVDTQKSTDSPFVRHAQSFFGTPYKRSKYMQFLIFISFFFMPKLFRSFLRLFTTLSLMEPDSVEYFKNIIDGILAEEQREKSERQNFISMCAEKLVDLDTVHKETVKVSAGRVWCTQGLTKDDIYANALVFFTAGYDTTAIALQFFFYNMAMHPDIQEKLHDVIADAVDEDGNIAYDGLMKIEYLDWCIFESLRMYPPAARFDRVAKEDITINDITVPKGMIVNLLVYPVHHDPDYWPQPEIFDPERFSPEMKTEDQKYAFIPFGSGNRSCIARRLALLEMRVAIVKLLMAFTFEKTAETPAQEDLKFVLTLPLLSTRTPVKLSAVPRN